MYSLYSSTQSKIMLCVLRSFDCSPAPEPKTINFIFTPHYRIDLLYHIPTYVIIEDDNKRGYIKGDIMETIRFVERFIVYIEDHLRENIDFAKTLDDMGVEQKSFLTIFTSLVGMTHAEYQEKRRMTEIAFEVYQRHRRIIDIIIYYGYRDLERVKTIYKRTFGISVHDTERHIKEIDLLEQLAFEVVPTTQAKYPSFRNYVESFRLIGIAQYFDANTYQSKYKYRFLKILENDGLLDELLRYNDEFMKGIFVQERAIEGEIEVFVDVASYQ